MHVLWTAAGNGTSVLPTNSSVTTTARKYESISILRRPSPADEQGNLISVTSSCPCFSFQWHNTNANHPQPLSEELHLRCCELYRRDSAGPGPAGRRLLPLQILQIQGPQLPHPLRAATQIIIRPDKTPLTRTF